MSLRRVVRSIQARDDVLDQYEHIGLDDEDAAERFLDAVEHAYTLLSATPDMGSPRHFAAARGREVRFVPVPGFRRHIIFYAVGEDEVRIVRVLHGARDLPSLFED